MIYVLIPSDKRVAGVYPHHRFGWLVLIQPYATSTLDVISGRDPEVAIEQWGHKGGNSGFGPWQGQ